MTIAGFVLARVVTEREAERDSEQRVKVAAAQIHSRVAEATALTESLRRFMVDEGGAGVTNAQFTAAALRWLGPANLPTVAWAEQVQGADRAAYEKRVGHSIVLPDARGTVSPPRSTYLPATLISGFSPMDRRGADIGGEPAIGTALQRAIFPGGVGATPVATQLDGTHGLFLIAPAPNLIDGALRPGAVVLFVPEATLRASASNPAGLRFAAADGLSRDRADAKTVREEFLVAGQQFAVVMPVESVEGPGAILPWIILATGLVLAAFASALGVNAARRARAQRDFDRIFNLSADLATVANFDGYFTRVNPAAEQVLGYTEEELLARPYLDFVHPQDRERTAAETAAIGIGRRTLSFENRYARKDGSYRVFEWTATAVPEERLMYSMARDVTERRMAEVRATRLAQEQAALRRVATLVAARETPDEIFSAVSEEVGRLFGSELACVARFEPDGRASVVAAASTGLEVSTEGRRELVDCIATEVLRTGLSARLEATELRSVLEHVVGQRQPDIASVVACPIVVAGRLWGTVSVWARESLPLDAEDRLESFTELIATAIGNAETRYELAASRKRIVASSDETRRRIERDLHDGAQQRLVTLALAARAAAASGPPEQGDLLAVLDRIATGMVDAAAELQELSRGIHPAIDSRGGLGAALRTLARRSAIPVELDLGTDIRLPEPIEVAAYFVASEAMANTAKHAHASRIEVALAMVNSSLVLSIRDDGIGGADPAGGSGLVGLADRVEALGGSVEVRSRPAQGTHITAELPLETEMATSREKPDRI
ncbi:MAG: two-component system sensor kinase [Frankiales bacterium]|nr:two-component system sensor kinase [Frankiales bacterium]